MLRFAKGVHESYMYICRRFVSNATKDLHFQPCFITILISICSVFSEAVSFYIAKNQVRIDLHEWENVDTFSLLLSVCHEKSYN